MHNRATTFGAASGRGDLPDMPNGPHEPTFAPDGVRAFNSPAPVADAHTGEPWEPLEQTFRSFSARRAVRLALSPGISWPERDFIDWTLEQLACARSSNGGALRP